MRAKRRNIELELALEPEAKGEARSAGAQGTETRMARAEPERPAAGASSLSKPVQPLKSVEPPCTDPYARWCGRGGAARLPPIPIPLRGNHLTEITAVRAQPRRETRSPLQADLWAFFR